MSKQEATTPEPLDIDAWIDGTELPEADVILAQKGSALRLRDELRKRRARDLRKRVRTPGQMVKDDAHELDEQIAELEAEIKASEVTFRVRGIDGDTHQAIIAEHKAAGEQAVIEAIVAAATVSPKLTIAQVHRLRHGDKDKGGKAQGIGEGQFRLLAAEVNQLSFEAPDLDF